MTILGNLHRPVGYLLSSIENKFKGDGSDINKFYSEVEEDLSENNISKVKAFALKRPTFFYLGAGLFGCILLEMVTQWIATRKFVQKIARGIAWVFGGVGVVSIIGGIISEFLNKGSGNSGSDGNGGRRDESPPDIRPPQRVRTTAPTFEDVTSGT